MPSFLNSDDFSMFNENKEKVRTCAARDTAPLSAVFRLRNSSTTCMNSGFQSVALSWEIWTATIC